MPHRRTSTDGLIPLLPHGLGLNGEPNPNIDNCRREYGGPYSPMLMLFGGHSTVEPIYLSTSANTDQKAFLCEEQGWKQSVLGLDRL